MPYIGWVELRVRLSSCDNDLKVQFLVTEQYLDSPLIGLNVIEEIVKSSNGDITPSQIMTSSFPDPVRRPTPVLFALDEANPWPNGLEVSETLLNVKKRKSSLVVTEFLYVI